MAAGGDGTARAPYAGGAPRRCQKSASPQVTSRRPCHSAPHIFWRPTIPIPRGRPLICIKERQSPQAPYPAAMPFTSRRFSGPHASGRLPYPGAAHARQQSPHVPTPQCGSSHTFAPFPHTLRRLPHLSIPWRNSPYKCQIPHRASKLHKIPHRTRRDQRSVHSNLRIQPAYADSLQQRGSSGNAQGAVPLGMGTTTVPSQHPPVGTSAYGRQPAETSDRFTQIKPVPFLRRGALRQRHDGVDVMGGHCMLWSGLKAGPGAAARLEAGNCEEGLACLFQVCAVLPHQACADGSVFFCRQLSKAGLSESIQHIRLVLDPSPVLTYTVQSWVAFINMCKPQGSPIPAGWRSVWTLPLPHNRRDKKVYHGPTQAGVTVQAC